MNNKLIICFYVGVGDDMSPQNVKEVMESTKEANSSIFTDNGVAAFFVPVKGDNSRIECVNPVLVTDEESKSTFNSSMERLNKVLQAAEKKEENEKAD